MNGYQPTSDGGGMGDEGAAGGSPPQAGAGMSEPIQVPMSMLPGCKVGDTYTVKSVDGDTVTLEAGGGSGMGDDGEGWGKGLVDAVNQKGT